MENLISKLLVMLTLTCVPLSGYCAGNDKAEGSNKDENAAISYEQPSLASLPEEILSKIIEVLIKTPGGVIDVVALGSTNKHMRTVTGLNGVPVLPGNYLQLSMQERLQEAARVGHEFAIRHILQGFANGSHANATGNALIETPRGVIDVVALESTNRHMRRATEFNGVPLLSENYLQLSMQKRLQEAARAGQGFAIRYRLQGFANGSHANAIGKALILAAHNGHLKVVKVLLKARADIRDEDIGVALIAAAYTGYLEVIDQLLACENIRGEDKGRALIAAARAGLAEMVEVLLQAGANVNITDIEGDTALIEAVRHRQKKVIMLLVGAGADVTIRDHRGRTALDWARQNNHPEVVQLLEQAQRQAQRAGRHPAAGRAQLGRFGAANARNATTDNAVPTPMPTPTIGCDLHARANMLSSVYESYL